MIDADASAFDQPAYQQGLASYLGVPTASIQLLVSAASVRVDARITPMEAHTSDSILERLTGILTAASASAELHVLVESVTLIVLVPPLGRPVDDDSDAHGDALTGVGGGLRGGAVAGIVAGLVVVLGLLGFVRMLYRRHTCKMHECMPACMLYRTRRRKLQVESTQPCFFSVADVSSSAATTTTRSFTRSSLWSALPAAPFPLTPPRRKMAPAEHKSVAPRSPESGLELVDPVQSNKAVQAAGSSVAAGAAAVQTRTARLPQSLGSRLTKLRHPITQPAAEKKPTAPTRSRRSGRRRRASGSVQLSPTTRVEVWRGGGGASAMLSKPRRTPPPNMLPGGDNPGFIFDFPVIPAVPFRTQSPIEFWMPSEAQEYSQMMLSPGHITRQPTSVSYLPNYTEPGSDRDEDHDVGLPVVQEAWEEAQWYSPDHFEPVSEDDLSF